MAEVRFNPDEIAKAIHSKTRKVIEASATMLETAIKANLNRGASNGGRTPSKAPAPPHKQDGALELSIGKEIVDDGRNIRAYVGSRGLVYAAIHEYGKTITPKTSKALTVPLNAKARKLRRHNDSLRKVSGLHFIKSKRGKNVGVLFEDKTGIPMFAIRRSVTIPKRPYVRPARISTTPKILELFKTAGLVSEIVPASRGKTV